MKFLIASLDSIGLRHLRNFLILCPHNINLYRMFLSTLPSEELVEFRLETGYNKALVHYLEAVILAIPP